MEFFDYGAGVIVSKKYVENIADSVIGVIKTELPEEAQCPCVIESVLEDVKEIIRHKQLKL